MPVQLVAMHELFPDNRSTATGISYFMNTMGAVLGAIVIGVALDTVSQVESHLIQRHYGGFLKGVSVKGRR